MTNEQKIHAMIEELRPKMTAWRRDFHKYPESGWTEFRTTAVIAKHLMNLGCAVTMGKKAVSGPDRMGVPSDDVLEAQLERAVAQGADKSLVEEMRGGYTGLWTDLVCGSGKGKTIAIRFDIDANDCAECTEPGHFPADNGFASVNPVVMHACGHDGHAAIGLVVAEIVARYKNDINGTVRLMFQPAEEGVRGAYPMVRAGAVDGVDVVLGLHIGVGAKTLGTFVCGCEGFLATTKMDVEITGLSAHAGGSPEQGRNELLAACAASTNLHAISRHSGGTTRITVGKLIAGQGRNVIPPNATLVMETRGETTELNEYMEAEANRIIRAAAEMWGCTHVVRKMGAAANAASDAEIAGILESVAKEMGVYDKIVFKDVCSGSDDFTYMLDAVQKAGGKGSYCLVGSPLKAGHHNDKFDYDEEVIPRGAEITARAIWKILAG
jgi:aminobenzoyl-glutamate utilization protein A